MTEPFIPSKPLHTPILFMIFNRFDTAKQVFAAIRHAKTPRLYVASDGPRVEHPGEDKKVQAVRDYVMSNIDWPCEVKTLLREKIFVLQCPVKAFSGFAKSY